MDKQKNLVLTMGLPRCGKSTWANQQGVPVVSPDAIRLALYGELWKQEGEPMVWTIAKYMVRALFIAGHGTVILDATNVSHRRRDEWLSSEWTPYIKIFRVPASVCTPRADATNQSYLRPVIQRMALEWEEPSEQWTVIEELSECK